MSTEAVLNAIIIILVAFGSGFVHHLYQCRKMQRTLGRILQKLGMDDD